MGIEREIWQVGGIKRAGLLATDNIKVNLQGIGKRIIKFCARQGQMETSKFVDKISGSLE